MPGYLGELADFKASYGKAVDAARGALGRSRANDGPEDPEAAQRNSSSAAAAAEACGSVAAGKRLDFRNEGRASRAHVGNSARNADIRKKH